MKTSEQPQHLCFLKAFEKVPDQYLILSPELIILTASDAYLKATCTVREEIAGKYLFDSYPASPMAWVADAEKHLRHSLQQVLATGQLHRMPVQCSDIPHAAQPGGLAEKYWLPLNTPVLDEQGQVQYIIHKVEDVTEKIITENKLVREFRHLKDAQAIGRIGSFERLLTDDVITCSNEWYRLHGLEPQSEVITLERMYSFFHPEDRQVTLEAIHHTLTTGEPLHLVSRIIRADGAVRYMQRKAEVLQDDQGQPYKVYGIVQDITGQVEALRKTEEREALLRSTEEVANLGSYELDVATMVIRFSDGLYRLFGESSQTFVPSLSFIEERSHPDDVPVVKAILEEAIHNKTPYHYTRRIRRADGTWRTLEAQGRVGCNSAGKAVKLIGLVQDVTDRIKAEQKLKEGRELLKTTVDSSMDMIQVFEAVRNESGDIIDFRWILNNRTAEEIYGDVVTKSLLEHNPGVLGVGIFDTFKRVVETGIPDQTERHYVHEQFDGWFYQSTVKLYDGVATTTKDITKRKKAEQQLKESKALFQSVLNNTASSIMLLKPVKNEENSIVDFQYTYTNEQTLKSVKRSTLVGKRFLEEFPEVHDSELFHRYVQVVETGREYQDQVDISFFGFPVWAQVYAQKLDDALLVTYFDITDRKKAGQELEESKNLLQTVFDVSLNPIAYHKAVRDESGKIVDFEFQLENKVARRYTVSDRTGKRYSEAYPGIRDTIVFQKYREVVETGEKLDTEVQVNLNGNDFWFHLQGVKLGDGLVATAVDITARKKAELEILRLKDEVAQRATDKYYSLFNSIDEGFCIMELLYNEDGKIADLIFQESNASFNKHTGLGSVAGEKVSELLPNFEQHWINMYKRVAETGEVQYYENYMQDVGRWYGTNFFRIGGAGSRLVAVAFTDITDRIKAEKALRESDERKAFLLKMSDALRPLHDALAIEETVTRLAMDYFGSDRCYYCQIEGDQAIIRRDAAREGLPSVAGVYQMSTIPIFKAVVDSGKPFVVHDVYHSNLVDESLRQLCIQLQVISFMDIPVIKKGIPVGILCVVHSTPREWTALEIELAEEKAERTWAGVERAKAEEALRRSEEKYRTLFDSMDEGYCIIQMIYDDAGKAADFLYLQVNQAFERNTGLHNAEGKTIRELAPDIEPKWMEIYDQVAQSGKPLRFEEGSEALHHIFSLYAFRIGDPAEHKVAVIFSDITERKKSLEALRQSEEQFRLFVTASSDIIYKMSADWSRMHKLTRKDFLPDTEEPSDSWTDVYIPAEARMLVEATIQQAIQSKKTFELEHRVNKADGTVGWVSSRAIPVVDAQGNIREWFGTASDISLRKEAEQQLHDLNESLEQLVAERTHELQESKQLLQTVFDTTQIQISILKAVRDEQGNILDFRIEFVNKELERVTGRRDLVGKPYFAEYSGIKTAGLFDIMLQVMETGQPKGTEYFYPYDGFDKWFSCMFVRLNDGLVATNLDITERKQAEVENLNLKLKKQKELLIAILEAQEEERSRISESLHNGVAQILYAAKLRVDGLTRKVQSEYVEKLDKLLQDAIHETRRASHELVPNVLKDFGLEQAILEMCGRFEDGNIRLEYEVEAFKMKLEPYQELAIYRISQELINNVIKHSKATDAKLLLYQEDEMIHLKVRDNGIGLKERPSKHIGIGLRSIENTVKLLNGTFDFSIPSSGSGTQVTIKIPIEKL